MTLGKIEFASRGSLYKQNRAGSTSHAVVFLFPRCFQCLTRALGYSPQTAWDSQVYRLQQ